MSWALSALEKAVKRRCPDSGLLPHSDQGCTYAGEDYRTRLVQHGITCSMSRRGNCDDNAVMESWFVTVKSEEGERFESYAHAKEALFDYRGARENCLLVSALIVFVVQLAIVD